MTAAPQPAIEPIKRSSSPGEIDSDTLELLSARALGGMHTVSLGQRMGQQDTQRKINPDKTCKTNSPPTVPFPSVLRYLLLALATSVVVLGSLLLYPRQMENDPLRVPQVSIKAPTLDIPIDPAPKTDAVMAVTTVDIPYEMGSGQAKSPVPTPLPSQQPISQPTTTAALSKATAVVPIEAKPEIKADHKAEQKVDVKADIKVEKITEQRAEKSPPMLQEVEDKRSTDLAHAPRVPLAEGKRKEADSGRLIAIAPDGQSAAFFDPTSRVPVQVRPGSLLSNGEKIVAINSTSGIVTTDKREYVLE